MEYKDFTSLPPEQEQSFVIYERTSNESAKKASTLGMIVAGVVGVFAIAVFLSFDAAENAHAVHEETDIKEEKKAPAKKAAPKPTPAAEIPAEPAEAAAEGAAPAAGEAAAAPAAAPVTAPAPPKGATKAPPTALIGQ